MDLLWIPVDALAVLTVVGQVIVVVLLLILLKEKVTKSGPGAVSRFIDRHGLLLMLVVALIATSGSLYFSEFMHWRPCRMCWMQRVFMYPQVLMLALALLWKDRRMARYILLFCVLGMLAATYHYYEQIISILRPLEYDVLKPCDPTGVSCRATEIFYYSYITIPLMAFTAFVLNAIGAFMMIGTDRAFREALPAN